MCVRKQNWRSKPLRSFAWKNVRLGFTFWSGYNGSGMGNGVEGTRWEKRGGFGLG